MMKNEVEQNIVERYNHEKNKIFFLIFTVKKLQKALKKNKYPSLRSEYFLTSILLLKKAEILNNCNLQLISQKKNVYNF